MKAAVCRDFGKSLDVEEVALDQVHRGEIRVKVSACGICQSDIHYMAGAWGGELPAVFGHEIAGTIEEVGEGVDDFHPGQAVVVIACCVMTGFGAVVNTAAVAPGDSVVVIGTGGVGLNAVQAAVVCGANPVIALDISPEKLPVARSFGATHSFDARADGARETVRELTGGRFADVVIVAAGSGQAVEQGLRMIGRGGTVVVVGMPESAAVSQLPVTAFAYQGQRILGSKMGGAQPHVDVPRLVTLHRQGRLKLDELVSACFPLDHINDAIASSSSGTVIRNVIVFPA
ncbi:MAG: zinc-binding dehydrogenase [Chloroflexi bacterium]|nr:MAG: zinc-binding dehydrogenase [Chloroflexota bacterium]